MLKVCFERFEDSLNVLWSLKHRIFSLDKYAVKECRSMQKSPKWFQIKKMFETQCIKKITCYRVTALLEHTYTTVERSRFLNALLSKIVSCKFSTKTKNVVSQFYMDLHHTMVNVECKLGKFIFQNICTEDNCQLIHFLNKLTRIIIEKYQIVKVQLT